MTLNNDQVLLETTRVRRDRLSSALVHGGGRGRRSHRSNFGRFLGAAVLAAVFCLGFLGTGFVLGILETRQHEKALSAFRDAAASNPIRPGKGFVEDKETGLLKNSKTGEHIDPRTGFAVDPKTMLAKDPQGRTIDVRLNWYFDPQTGHYTDPETGTTVDPETLTVVED